MPAEPHTLTVDPGETTGWALWTLDWQLIEAGQTPLWEFIDELWHGTGLNAIDGTDGCGTFAGVVSIISFEGEPAPIPEHEIDGIRQLVETDLAYDPCPMIREGMMVEVAHGPLKGVIGRLVRKGAKARLVLSVDLIGQAVSVEVDAADVKAY